MSKEISIPYVAGLFDGEGSVGIYEGDKRNFNARVQLTQNATPTTLPLWEKLHSRWGGNLSTKIRPAQNATYQRNTMNWQLGQFQAYDFLADIRHFVIIKADQVELFMSWFEDRPTLIRDSRGRYLPRSEEDILTTRAVAARLKDMKRAVSE